MNIKTNFENKNINSILNIITRIVVGYLLLIYVGSYKLDFGEKSFSFILITITFLTVAISILEVWIIYFFYISTLFLHLDFGWINVSNFSSLFSYSSIETMMLIVPLIFTTFIFYRYQKRNIFLNSTIALLLSWLFYFLITSLFLKIQIYTYKTYIDVLLEDFFKNILIYFSFGIIIIIIGPIIKTKYVKEKSEIIIDDDEI